VCANCIVEHWGPKTVKELVDAESSAILDQLSTRLSGSRCSGWQAHLGGLHRLGRLPICRRCSRAFVRGRFLALNDCSLLLLLFLQCLRTGPADEAAAYVVKRRAVLFALRVRALEQASRAADGERGVDDADAIRDKFILEFFADDISD
jgi:hypothetical protein